VRHLDLSNYQFIVIMPLFGHASKNTPIFLKN
jgi:hypothetical protein